MLTALLLSSANAGQEPAPRAGTAALQSLLDGARSGALKQAEVTARIAQLGPAAILDVGALLAGNGRAGDGAPFRLSPSEEALLLAVVPRWPAGEVARYLETSRAGRPALSKELLDIRLLGAAGSSEAVAPLIALLGDVEPEHLQAKLVQDAAERAWVSLLAADREATLLALRPRLASLDPLLYPALVGALAQLESGATVPILERLEQASPALDALLLDAFGRIPRWDSTVQDGSVKALVRGRLFDAEAGTRRAAALALGRLEDGEAASDLLLLLADEHDARVRRAAFDALRSGGGARVSGSLLEPWTRWLAEEEAWFAQDAPDLVAAAVSGSPAEAVAALRQLSAHPLHRERLAHDLQAALERPEEAVVTAACGALARLRAGASVRPLCALIDDPRAGVRAAAVAALRATTDGRFPELPGEQRAWAAAL